MAGLNGDGAAVAALAGNGFQGGAAEQVAQFADVTRPRVAQQTLAGIVGQTQPLRRSWDLRGGGGLG